MSEYGDFFDYIHEGNIFELNHSGIQCNMGYVNPRYDYPLEKRLAGLNALKEYAYYSIEAYRAIEYWAQFHDFPSTNWQMSERAREILNQVQKPKTYLKFNAVRVSIE